MPENGVAAQVFVARVTEAVEKKIPRSVNPKERLALERAQQHLYEAMFWLDAADAAGSSIVRP